MKRVLLLSILVSSPFQTNLAQEEATSRNLAVGRVPVTVIEAADMCIAGCVQQHCAGAKLVLTPDGLEAFQPENPTADLCTEKALLAVDAQDMIVEMLGKVGLPTHRPQVPTKSLVGRLNQRARISAMAISGQLPFWAARQSVWIASRLQWRPDEIDTVREIGETRCINHAWV